MRYFEKVNLSLKLSLLSVSRPKSATASPTFGSHCSRFHPNRFTSFARTVFAPQSIYNIGSLGL